MKNNQNNQKKWGEKKKFVPAIFLVQKIYDMTKVILGAVYVLEENMEKIKKAKHFSAFTFCKRKTSHQFETRKEKRWRSIGRTIIKILQHPADKCHGILHYIHANYNVISLL